MCSRVEQLLLGVDGDRVTSRRSRGGLGAMQGVAWEGHEGTKLGLVKGNPMGEVRGGGDALVHNVCGRRD